MLSRAAKRKSPPGTYVLCLFTGRTFRYFRIQQRDSNATATRQQRERRLKCEFAFLPIYFVKCRRTLQKLNSKGPYLSSEREIKFRRCLFLLSTKREVRHFYVVVVQNGEEMYKKVWSTCEVVVLLIKTYCFLTFSLRSRRWILQSLLVRQRGTLTGS